MMVPYADAMENHYKKLSALRVQKKEEYDRILTRLFESYRAKMIYHKDIRTLTHTWVDKYICDLKRLEEIVKEERFEATEMMSHLPMERILGATGISQGLATRMLGWYNGVHFEADSITNDIIQPMLHDLETMKGELQTATIRRA